MLGAGLARVDLRSRVAAATGLPVHVENSGRACALAQLWLEKAETAGQSFVYISVSDGVGTGIVVNGELIRGRDHIAGEFGHMPIDLEGRVVCAAPMDVGKLTFPIWLPCRAIWVEFVQTQSKTFERAGRKSFTILDLIARARSGDSKALAAVQTSGRFLGLGLATVVNIINPDGFTWREKSQTRGI